jgi:hypothetical protein
VKGVLSMSMPCSCSCVSMDSMPLVEVEKLVEVEVEVEVEVDAAKDTWTFRCLWDEEDLLLLLPFFLRMEDMLFVLFYSILFYSILFWFETGFLFNHCWQLLLLLLLCYS